MLERVGTTLRVRVDTGGLIENEEKAMARCLTTGVTPA